MPDIPGGETPEATEPKVADDATLDEVIATARKVAITLDGIGDSLKAIESYGRRTRQIAVALIISLLVDVLLTVTIGIVTSLTFNLQSSLCSNANVARTNQIQIWHFFLALIQDNPPPSGQTEQQTERDQREIASLYSFVDHTFTPIKC